MAQNPFFTNWMKNIPTMPQSPMDLQSMMEQGRKTFQAITEAQQTCVENMQAIAQRQAEILSQIAEDQSCIAREMAGDMTPEQKVARGAELVRKAYEKSVSGARDVSDMVQKSSREMGDIINRRIHGALNDIKSAACSTDCDTDTSDDMACKKSRNAGRK